MQVYEVFNLHLHFSDNLHLHNNTIIFNCISTEIYTIILLSLHSVDLQKKI